MNKKKVLVTNQFVGELGWSVISWQPLIRNMFLSEGYEKCIVYDQPGRNFLYRFAEVRSLDNVPEHESECMVWHDFQEHTDELNALISKVVEIAKKEFGDDCNVFTYGALPALNKEYYERGRPDLLYATKDETDESVRKEIEGRCPMNRGVKTIVFCIRDREMSDFRNWEYENWADLAANQLEERNVILIGKVRDHDRWKEAMPEGCIDLTNRTTIDDCIAIFTNYCGLAVGTTGTIHLASRCGVDHLVWGNQKTVVRCAEANFFGARQKTYPIGFDPEPDTIAAFIEHYFDKRTFA